MNIIDLVIYSRDTLEARIIFRDNRLPPIPVFSKNDACQQICELLNTKVITETEGVGVIRKITDSSLPENDPEYKDDKVGKVTVPVSTYGGNRNVSTKSRFSSFFEMILIPEISLLCFREVINEN